MAEEIEIREGFFDKASAVIAAVYDRVMEGGQIQAAVRQGFNELGAALKAFPDSMQIDEPGQVFNPLYSDIAADKRAHANDNAIGEASLPSPAEIAGGKSGGSVLGDERQVSRAELPSPAEIASNIQPSPMPEHGQEMSQSHGRSM